MLMHYGGSWGYGGGMGYFGMGLGLVLHVLVLAVLVMAAVWLYRALRRPAGTAGEAGATDALEVLKMRLARGEITPEEYRERKAELEK